jgi:hypothetical protein
MTNEEYFPDIETNDRTNFKTNVFIKPRQDMKMNVGREFHIVRAVETRNLFEPSCASWDRVNGYMRETKEKKLCAECQYLKGLPQGEGKLPIKCQAKYALYMEHDSADKEYVLSISVPVYKVFYEYRKSLLEMGLDVNKVITRVTREEPEKGNGYAYKFEFVSELDLDILPEEAKALSDITGKYKIMKKEETVNDTAELLKTLLEIDGIVIDESRAKRLALTLSKDGIIIDPRDL